MMGGNHIMRGRLRLLLASSSVAAILLGGGARSAFAACAINDVGVSVASVSNAAAINCINVQTSTVTGNVTNTASGSLTPVGITPPTATGITINGSKVGGSVVNAGIITAPLATGIVVTNNSSVAGGVTNSGSLSAGIFGINVFNNGTFGGGISNSGTVSVGGTGVIAAFIGTFTGGITNSGTVTAGLVGIAASGDLSFAGGITNAATGIITGANAGISVTQVTTFLGGISNAGTITSVRTGIFIDGGNTFSGGIGNTGIISAANVGIQIGLKTGGGTLFGVTSFSGNVSNAGIITAKTGISIVGSTVNGAIVDSGTLNASTHGILIDNASKVAASVTAIKISGSTFTGGINNAGTIISASGEGIRLTTPPNFVATFFGGITNSGTISAGGAGFFGDGIDAFGTSTFSGGITNSGTITSAHATPISVGNFKNFSGGIRNSGTLVAGVAGSGIVVAFVSTLTGGIANSGTISGHTQGIFALSLSTFSGGISNSGTLLATGIGGVVGTRAGISVATVSAFSGGISNSGTISVANGGAVVNNRDGIVVAGVSTFVGGISNSGTISVVGTPGVGISVSSVSTFSGNISNASAITANTGIKILSNVTFAGGGAVWNSGTITGIGGTAIDDSAATNAVTLNQTAGAINGAIKLSSNADVLNVMGGTINGNIVGAGSSNTLNFALGAGTFTYANSFTGINQANFNSGTVVLEGADTVSHVAINGGTVVVGNDLAFGSAPIAMAAGTTLSFLNTGNFSIANPITITGDPNFTPPAGTTQTLAGVISGTGTFNMNGAGTLVLSAINTYTGPTDVNSGILDVSGSIASSSAVNVASGGTLTGSGSIDTTLVTIHSGATFAPGTPGVAGTSMAIGGDLAFQSGAIYLVQLNPATASRANVSGTASLNGTVQANFAAGSYVVKQYTILTAAGGVSGTFAGISNIGLPAGFADSLSYSANNVFLNLAPGFTQFTGLNTNQQNVANALTNFFNTTGSIPSRFANLTPAGLTQLDGENATGAERASYDLMNEFLNLMLDPFVDGRGGYPAGGGATPLGFAPDQLASLPPDIALAYAGVFKAPPPAPVTFDQRWTSWAAGFGGRANANGDPAVGSNNVTTSTYGYAAGTDYHFSPNSVLGFSLAGGGTNWNLANALGTGRSNAFLAGVYGVTHAGPVYLAAALAFANNWFTTNRGAMGDVLTANFQGQSYAGRLEAGYRYTVPAAYNLIGLTPYAAIQAQDFHTPGYSETDLSGGGFGLSYNAMNGTDTRSELGGRFDDLTAVAAMPVILRARIAWAHDWVSNPALNASFQSLPGTSFTVFGAPIPQDSALASAGAQFFFTPNWSFLAKFDGEFASGSQVYAGSGTLRYTW